MSDLVFILTRRTLRPSKSTFPPRRAASTASLYLIPVGLPSSVMRGSLPIGPARGTVTRGVRELPLHGVLRSSFWILAEDFQLSHDSARAQNYTLRHLFGRYGRKGVTLSLHPGKQTNRPRSEQGPD